MRQFLINVLEARRARAAPVGLDEALAKLNAQLVHERLTFEENQLKREKHIAELRAEIKRLRRCNDELQNIVSEETQNCITWSDEYKKLRGRFKQAMKIGTVHVSWSTVPDYQLGWNDCREQFRELLQGKPSP